MRKSHNKRNVGILNSRSQMWNYLRSLKHEPTPAPSIRRDVTRQDLEILANVIAAKYSIAIWHNCDVRIREYERQLSLLTEYVGVMQ